MTPGAEPGVEMFASHKRRKTDANVMLIMTQISAGEIRTVYRNTHLWCPRATSRRKGITFDSDSSYKTYKATDGEGMFDDLKHLSNESVCTKTLLVMYD